MMDTITSVYLEELNTMRHLWHEYGNAASLDRIHTINRYMTLYQGGTITAREAIHLMTAG